MSSCKKRQIISNSFYVVYKPGIEMDIRTHTHTQTHTPTHTHKHTQTYTHMIAKRRYLERCITPKT